MKSAASKVGIKEDFGAWADTWLKTAGVNEIWHEITEKDGKIDTFTVQQRVHKNGQSNRLRQQSYVVDFLDKDMNVILS